MLKEIPKNLAGQPPTVTDWDGDGYLDLIVTGAVKNIKYYTLGACYPQAQPYCKLGSCNHKTAQCNCYSGVEGSECSRCSKFHFKESEACKACTGYGTLEGTCSKRGVCEDDDDARSTSQAANMSNYQVLTSFGSGQCKCLTPFHGDGCHDGECPSGQFLQADAEVPNISDWYPNWDACMPCESGHYKNFAGNAPCDLCEAGRYQQFVGQTDCLACPAGRSSQPGASECYVCPYAGTHSSPGSATCDPCPDGFVASENHSTCVRPGGCCVLHAVFGDVWRFFTRSKLFCLKRLLKPSRDVPLSSLQVWTWDSPQHQPHRVHPLLWRLRSSSWQPLSMQKVRSVPDLFFEGCCNTRAGALINFIIWVQHRLLGQTILMFAKLFTASHHVEHVINRRAWAPYLTLA